MTAQCLLLWLSIIAAVCIMGSLAIVRYGKYCLRNLELEKQKELETTRNNQAVASQKNRNDQELALLGKKHNLEKQMQELKQHIAEIETRIEKEFRKQP